MGQYATTRVDDVFLCFKVFRVAMRGGIEIDGILGEGKVC